jgi:hypothetical protein
MPLTKYKFSNAVNAFFEMPTETATALLPKHLQPLELRHDSSILAVTAFHFTESMVGDYHEAVLAVIVPPMVKPGGVFPKSAYFPFLVGTSTKASREHAIERWHLPHYMADIHVDLVEKDGAVDVLVHEKDRPIVDFRITAHKWSIVDQLYQCFMIDEREALQGRHAPARALHRARGGERHAQPPRSSHDREAPRPSDLDVSFPRDVDEGRDAGLRRAGNDLMASCRGSLA